MTLGRIVGRLFIALLAAVVWGMQGACAHESRPAYLEINETAPGRYDVIWRTPQLSGMPLPVILRFPEGVRNVTEPSVRELPDSVIERRLIEVVGGLAGKRIEFVGLEVTITDILARVQLRDGEYSTTLVRPVQPWVEIAAARGVTAVFAAYLRHGVDHILFGYDHLLFVFALILIVRTARMLVWTITAFTVAHSITLALATLGLVRVPTVPVEAVIALSILLLATEIVKAQRGESTLTARVPWIVAFVFGLLHGFGFASALVEIGLPRSDVPLALLAFNIGVELGQLAFVAAVLCAWALLHRMRLPAFVTRRALPLATYGIGSLAAFWFFERLAGF